MAKNWTLAELVQAVADGKAAEVTELGKRYPLVTVAVAGILAKSGDEFRGFMSCMPDYLTAGKMNKMLDGGAAEETEDAGEEEAEEKEVKAASKKEEKAADAGDLESKGVKELYKMCKDAGIEKKLTSTKKADMIAALKANAGKGKKKAEEPEADEEDEATDYSEMSAMELYKECKKRKIAAEPKKPAKYYIELLKKDDEPEEEDEDWGEEEEEETPKETKKAAGKGKAAAGKSKKEEDDDDWDI